jgi:hypothetical protein
VGRRRVNRTLAARVELSGPFEGGFAAVNLAASKSGGKADERWAVAKLVRHQALDLAFEGSNPSRPANGPAWEGLQHYGRGRNKIGLGWFDV